VVGAGSEPHHGVGLDVRQDQRPLAIVLAAAFIDREAQLGGRYSPAAGSDRVELQPARIENEALALCLLADRDSLGGARPAIGGVNEIAAGLEIEDGGSAL